MSVSDAEFAAWLRRKDVTKVILVEIDHVAEVSSAPVTQTLYFSNRPYVSAATDDPPSQRYTACINKAAVYTRALDRQTLGGKASISFGEVEIANANGAQDAILGYRYDGSECRHYFGDATWPKADFRLIFTSLGAAIRADTKLIYYSVTDSSALLDTALSGAATVGGTGPDADTFRPINIGYCHNVTLILRDWATLNYVYGNSSSEATLANVRAQGVAVVFTDNGDGTATLSASPNPEYVITGDVQQLAVGGDPDSYRASNVYTSYAGDLGGLLTRGLFLGAHSSYMNGDADDYHIGRSIRQAENIRDLLNELAASTNTFYGSTRDCKFTWGRIFPVISLGTPVIDLVKDDCLARPKVEEKLPLYDQVQCTGNKNWTQQSTLATGLTSDEVNAYTRKGFLFSQADPSGTSYVANPRLYHKTMGRSPVFDTLISMPTDADVTTELSAFSNRKRNAALTRQRLIDVSVGLRAYAVELGDPLTLTYDRFELDAGPTTQATSIAIDLNAEKVDLTLAYRERAGDTVWLMEDGVTPIYMEDGTSTIDYVI